MSYTYDMSSGLPATARRSFYIKTLPGIPTDVSLPSSRNITIGNTSTLTATFTPSGTASTLTWSSNNTSVATVNSSGTVTAVALGTATITVKTSNSLSATCLVTVTEPAFTLSGRTPSNNAENVSLNTSIYADFSLPLFAGTQYSNISLLNVSRGTNVSGSASISGSRLTFTPLQALEPNTSYKLIIPSSAVKNQWGTMYSSAVETAFKTVVLNITASTPVNNATGIPLNKILSVQFNSNLQQGTEFSSTSLTEANTSTVVPAYITLSGNGLIITPEQNLKYGTKYIITIPANALRDTSGSLHAQQEILNFTTILKAEISVTAGAGGTVSDGSLFEEGAQVTLTATPNVGYSFDGWYEDNKLISKDEIFIFIAEEDRTLEARFTKTIIKGDLNDNGNLDIDDAKDFLESLVGNKTLTSAQESTLEGIVDKSDSAIKQLRAFLNFLKTK